jgi:hypothetical protein
VAQSTDGVQGAIAAAGPAQWKSEILDFLLGRLTSGASSVELTAPHRHAFVSVPIRRWWIFEGKRYRYIDGPLVAAFDRIVSMARRLDATFNPRTTLRERPDGDVDWARTLARGPYHEWSDHVVRSSLLGLDDAERAALRGWVRWLDDEWHEYTRTIATDTVLDTQEFAAEVTGPFTVERLRRWAHVARRSRWPLMRDVVAETLRPVLEPDDLGALPLPSDIPSLFELLCLVRVARYFEPRPHDVRWLGSGEIGNSIQIGTLHCHYQQYLDQQDVLNTPDYAGALARAVAIFDVSVPRRMDIALDFSRPLNGFDGVLIEAKSGSQRYHDTVAQLRTYRQARRRSSQARYVVWGIVEQSELVDATPERLAGLLAITHLGEDLWLFSSADRIGDALAALFPRLGA